MGVKDGVYHAVAFGFAHIQRARAPARHSMRFALSLAMWDVAWCPKHSPTHTFHHQSVMSSWGTTLVTFWSSLVLHSSCVPRKCHIHENCQ